MVCVHVTVNVQPNASRSKIEAPAVAYRSRALRIGSPCQSHTEPDGCGARSSGPPRRPKRSWTRWRWREATSRRRRASSKSTGRRCTGSSGSTGCAPKRSLAGRAAPPFHLRSESSPYRLVSVALRLRIAIHRSIETRRCCDMRKRIPASRNPFRHKQLALPPGGRPGVAVAIAYIGFPSWLSI